MTAIEVIKGPAALAAPSECNRSVPGGDSAHASRWPEEGSTCRLPGGQAVDAVACILSSRSAPSREVNVHG